MKKVIRFVAILLMALTAGFTLLGGVGTSCVALNPTGFGDKMALLAPFQWLYVLYVLLTVAIGVLGIRATIWLVRGKPGAYRSALLALLLGTVVGAAHIISSRALRGASMPVDAVVYTTVLTLVVFLLLRIPALWQWVDFGGAVKRGEDHTTPKQISVLLGVLCLTIQFVAGPTHTWGGVNYADAFHATLTAVGVGLCAAPAASWLVEKSRSRVRGGVVTER